MSCDRATKHIAATTLAGVGSQSFLADTVRLHYVENTGGFLSLGADLPPAIRTGLLRSARASRSAGWLPARSCSAGPAALLGLTLFVAGGASNWVDRVAHGSVIDFINIGFGPIRTGIFNVADVAIMLGVSIVAVAELRRRTAGPPLPPVSTDGPESKEARL